MKKAWLFAALGAAIIVTACGSKKDLAATEVTANMGTSQSQTAAEETRQVSEAEVSAKALPGKESLKGFWVEGTVKEIADDNASVTITKSDGADLVISLDHVDIEISDEFKIGNSIAAVYAKDAVPESDAPLLIVDKQKDMKIMEVSGTVVSQAMSSFAIQTAGGKEFGFIKNDCPGMDTLGDAVDENNGSGKEVTVTYIYVTYEEAGSVYLPIMIE